jgi:membrane dipeptidase
MMSRRAFIQRTALAGAAGMISGTVFGAARKSSSKKVSLEEAWRLHKKCLIIDGHTDTPVERMSGRHELPMQWMESNPAYQEDIPRMRENGQQYVGFMIISAGRGNSPQAFRNFGEMENQFSQNPKDLMKVLNSNDAQTAGKSGKIGIINAIEGGWGPLDGQLENLQKFHDYGLRLCGISHGEGGSDPKYLQGTWSINKAITPMDRKQVYQKAEGLTSFGLEVLRFCNTHHIVTDLSHINDKAYFDVIEKSNLVPIVSHTAVYNLCQQGRCLTDDQIRALAARGGVMGITFVPEFIDNDPQKATIDRLIDHISYVADLVGIDHVGIGTDYDGGVPHPVIPEVSHLVDLTQGLMERGFKDEEIKMIWGKNFLRIIQKVMG